MTSRRLASIAVGLAVLAAAGCGGDGDDRTAAAPPATTIAASRPTTAPPRTTSTTTSAPPPTTRPPATTSTTTTTTIVPIVTHAADVGVLHPATVANPVRVEIPEIGIDGLVAPAGVDGDGRLDVPPDARTLVWYRFGPTPGAPGSAVIAGHLDWRGVEGIFSDLAAVPLGAAITITYDDGSQQSFVARSVELVDKPAVAVNGVFARDGEPVVRLVTCGGDFDSSTRHYLSNVVVTAVAA